ncbi:MAG: hypothetical protein ABWX84_07020 [Nocardioides sp.]
MTEADTTRGRHVVVGATREEAVSYFGLGLEDAFVTSFSDFANEVPPGTCSQVSLLWDEDALPVLRTLLDRVAEDPEIRLVVASRGEPEGMASTAPSLVAGDDDWTVDSLNLKVAELERELGVARADNDAARALLATARARNRRLRGQVDTIGSEPAQDPSGSEPSGSLNGRRRRLAAGLSGALLVLAVGLPVALAAADDFSLAAVTSALSLGVSIVLLVLLGVAALVLRSELGEISEHTVELRAQGVQCNDRAADLDVRLHGSTERMELLSSRVDELGEEQRRALADLRHRVTIAYGTGAAAAAPVARLGETDPGHAG